MITIRVNAEELITGTTDLLIDIGIIYPWPEEELMPMAALSCVPYTPDKNGFFGSEGNNEGVRHMSGGEAESVTFFNWISSGGTLTTNTDTMKIARMPDGSYIIWRKTSSSDGTPAVDINPQSSSYPYAKQKIHFVA